MSIYVATHKHFDYHLRDGYIPIQVGAALNEDLGYLKDNDGDNISEKNPNYCELTALYYISKNRQSDDIVGLVHYRRYFFKGISVINFKDACKLLRNYDIILPYKFDLKESVEEQYRRYHHIEDLRNCRHIIEKECPEYLDSFNKIMTQRYVVAFNMFIMRNELLREYCDWLFSILAKLEKQVDVSNYDDYNKRIFGFLSERLFNVWIHKRGLKIRYLPVYNIEDSLKLKIKDYVKGVKSTYFK